MKRTLKILKSIALIILSSIFSISTCTAAVPDEQTLDRYGKIGAYYYNSGGNDNVCNITSTTLSGNSAEEKIWNYFIQHGFSDAQAAGLLGNGKAESGFVPTRSSNGSFFGLFQWGGGRKDNLFKDISAAGLSKYLSSEYWGSNAEQLIPKADYDKLLQIELDFTLKENDLNWQKEIKKADTPEMAAEVFLTLFERAINGESEIKYYTPYIGRFYQNTEGRRNYARTFYNQYAGKGIQNNTISGIVENGKNVSIIGDSITVRSTNAFKKQFPDISDADINARSGRSWSEGIRVAKTMNLKDTVIFALGTNSSKLTTSSIDEAISVIGPNKKIVFFTNYHGKNKNLYTSNNNLFKSYSKTNPNIIIADWATIVDQNPNAYLVKDMFHPNGEGEKLFAETAWNAINSNTNENGCSISGDFQSLVLKYAWPDFHREPWHDRMPAYAEAVTRSISEGRYVGGSVAGIAGIDCGGFVTILAQNSGLEPNYNDTKGNTDGQEAWVKKHGWELINDTPDTVVDTSLLQPGDIAFSRGHTFIYVGEIPGFNSVIASASYSDVGAGRAPMAGREDLTFGNGSIVRWYRKPNYKSL